MSVLRHSLMTCFQGATTISKMTLSIIPIIIAVKSATWGNAFSIMLRVIRLSVVMLRVTRLGVAMLSVIMLSVMAPLSGHFRKGKVHYNWPTGTNQFSYTVSFLGSFFNYLAKRVILLWRSILLSLPLLLVFPGRTYHCQ